MNPFSSIKWTAIAGAVVVIARLIWRSIAGIKKAQRNEIALEAHRKEQANVKRSREAAKEIRRVIRDEPDADLDQRLRAAGLA
mgnify:CR=1 FL=1